jgi:hypothetical protein
MNHDSVIQSPGEFVEQFQIHDELNAMELEV